MQWRPDASLDALRHAARLRSAIHGWMDAQGLLEVVTPPLSSAGNPDPHVESLLVTSCPGQVDALRYLHTSPEFAMKRILCAHPTTDLYQIATVFRAEEHGRYHNSQFSLLEWYRTGMDHLELMQDVRSLFRHLWQVFDLEFPAVDERSYCDEVFSRLGRWPDELDGVTVRDYFHAQERAFPSGLEDDVNASLDLFMDEFVFSQFPERHITFLYDYPVAQAALARLGKSTGGRAVAQRFEVFFGSIELGNGFHELNDASVQRQRFAEDQGTRLKRQQHTPPVDERLLAALGEGLPACAGIAVGLERLQMALGDYSHINQVLAFSDENA